MHVVAAEERTTRYVFLSKSLGLSEFSFPRDGGRRRRRSLSCFLALKRFNLSLEKKTNVAQRKPYVAHRGVSKISLMEP